MTPEDDLRNFASNDVYEQMCVKNVLLFFRRFILFLFRFSIGIAYQTIVFCLLVNSFLLKVVLHVPQFETP